MISLQIQDQIDGSNKVEELKAVVGQTYSDNFSSTGRSKLVSYDPEEEICIVEEVASKYKCGNQNPKPGNQRRYAWLVWNGFFY